MKEKIKDPVAVLLGADLNCYSMARAFYEASGRGVLAFGKCRLFATAHSRFLTYTASSKMKSDEGRLALLFRVAQGLGHRVFLIGCSDEYVSFIIRHREQLEMFFLLPYPERSVLSWADKGVFCRLAARYGLPHPATVILSEGDLVPRELSFAYPIVLKPAVSEEYWKHPFAGMKKVYFPKNRREAEAICEKIRSAGYRKGLILQRRISGGDADNAVLTAYSDRTGVVRALSFGRVLLEEHGEKGLGNHAAILTAQPPPVAEKIRHFLNDRGYVGFSNFDLMYDREREEYLVLEVNLRQGRSNHYMTASGVNPAALLLADYGGMLVHQPKSREVFWYSVPPCVVYGNIRDPELRERCRCLEKAGRGFSPYQAMSDLRHNLFRRLYLWEHNRRVLKRAEKEPIKEG